MRLPLQDVRSDGKEHHLPLRGYKQGIASNHGDVMHWFPKHGKSMDTFRAAVKELWRQTPKPIRGCLEGTTGETTTRRLS